MKTFVAGCCYALVAFLATPALAHHSAAGVDQTRSVTIVGVLKEFKWANPHSWMDIEVTDDKGVTKLWSVEMTAPTFLVRAGWTAKTVKAGDKVTVTVRPMRNGDPGGLFVNIVLPDGRTLGQAPAAPRATQ
jgi:hypothetical protein